MKLSHRLEKVAQNVPDHARVADIGSDHAKLLLFLLEKKKIDFAVAGEVAKGPYQIAQERSEGLPIMVRMADGLEAIHREDAIDTVVIAGMGGQLIRDILARGQAANRLEEVFCLVLQPNNDEDELRKWLCKNFWQLSSEEILQDRGKVYEILVAKKGERKLSEREIKFGPYLLQENSLLFRNKWKQRLKEVDKILRLLPTAQARRRQRLEAEQVEIEEVLRNENQRSHGSL